MVAKGKHANVVTGAIAREFVGFVWAIAKEVPIPLSRPTNHVLVRNTVSVRNTVRRYTNVPEKRRSPGLV